MRKAVKMKKNTPTLLLGALAAVAALTLSGCVNPVDAVVDRVLEGQGVDIDQNGGTVTIEGQDGEKLVVGGTEVPDDFPSELPLPDGKPQAAVSSSDGVSLSYEAVGEEQIAAMTEKIEALGYERTYDLVADQTIMRYFENPERSVSLIWDGSGEGALVYAITAKG